eukprot:scaffold1405_cov93-Isochrysis_galbana.AAC.3
MPSRDPLSLSRCRAAHRGRTRPSHGPPRSLAAAAVVPSVTRACFRPGSLPGAVGRPPPSSPAATPSLKLVHSLLPPFTPRPFSSSRQVGRQTKSLAVSTQPAGVSVAGVASFGESLTIVATLYTSKKGSKDFSEKVHTHLVPASKPQACSVYSADMRLFLAHP